MDEANPRAQWTLVPTYPVDYLTALPPADRGTFELFLAGPPIPGGYPTAGLLCDLPGEHISLPPEELYVEPVIASTRAPVRGDLVLDSAGQPWLNLVHGSRYVTLSLPGLVLGQPKGPVELFSTWHLRRHGVQPPLAIMDTAPNPEPLNLERPGWLRGRTA
jgi:hypothetical protein